jgi:DNA-binding transcriptional LysR family regulator
MTLKYVPLATQFDLLDVRLFANIAETKSLTHGAEHSNMSLPAASTRIKNIEQRLSMKLLYRANQGVTLTPAGQTFLQYGKSILQQVENLHGDLQQYARGVKGKIRILANTTAIEFLPAALGAYLASHPDVNVHLRERLSNDIVRAVMEETTDIGIVASTVSTQGMQVLPYRTDRLVLATALNHPLAKNKKIEFINTLDYDYVGLVEDSAMYTFLSQAAKNVHRVMKLRIEVSNFEALCRMVETNIGIGVLPESVARRRVRTMKLRIIPLSDEWAIRNLQICVRDIDALPAFARDLISLLTASGSGGPN